MQQSLNRKHLLSLLAASGLLLAAPKAQAMDTFLVGPRAMAMGGANVASPNDTTAQYYNPAQYGFFKNLDKTGRRKPSDTNDTGRKKWGFDVNAAGGYRLHNDLGQYIDDLSKIDYTALSSTGIASQSDLEDLVRLVHNLDGIDEPGNGITTDANAGLGIRVGHVGVGVRAFFQASGRVINLDTANLGITINGADLSADIMANVDPTFDPTTYTPQVFDSAQISQLATALNDLDAALALDYTAASLGITGTDIQGTVDILETVTSQSGASTLDQNTTTVRLSGFGLAEVPVSYGYAVNDHLAIGGNIKYMRGRVYGNEVLVFDQNSGDTLSKTDENYEESNAFGVDLGLLARLNKFNLGLVARNINAPEFDGPTITTTSGTYTFEDVKIDPQVTAGIAYIPSPTFTIEADIDLTENATALEGYHTRNLMVGIEWDILRILALRAGAYKNLAENDIDWVYTAGLGLNMWATRVDLAATYDSEKAQYDEEEYPKEFKVALELSVDF